MREIKFRAWDKRTKKMRQVIDIVFNAGMWLEPDDNTVKLIWVKGYDIIENKDIMMKREDKFELMQYTGLKDKNGTDIYEGDIVRQDDEYWLVQYDNEDAMFTLYYDNVIENFSNMNSKWFEVIGNIYENPELFKEE